MKPQKASPKPLNKATTAAKVKGQKRRTVGRGYTRSDPSDPSVQAAWTTTTPFTNVTSAGGSVRVTRTELFDYIITTGEGSYGAYWSVNPANAVLFPWLSSMAALFEQFEFKRFRVNFVPSSNYLATGTIALACEYDVMDNPNVDFADVSMYQGAVTAVVRAPASCDLVKQRCQMQRYYLLANGSYTIDRLTCPAWFVVAVQGGPQATPIGRLSVTYDVEFSSAQNPERPITLHSALGNCPGFELPYQAAGEPFWALSWTVSTPTGNVPNWFAHTSPGEFAVRDNVNEIQVAMMLTGTATAHPDSRAWKGTNWMSDHTCLVNVTGGSDGAPMVRANDYYVGCTDVQDIPGNCSLIFVFADLKRPALTMGDWTFRFEFYPATSETYTGGGNANTFTTGHIEVAACIS